MSNGLKIAALLAAGIAAVAAIWGVLFFVLLPQDEGRAGPNITIEDVVWGTRIHEGNGDHHTFAIWVDLIAPAGFDAQDFDPSTGYMTTTCQSVIDAAEQFLSEGVAKSDINHVDINFEIGGEMGWPVELTVLVDGGVCIDRFQVGGHGQFANFLSGDAFSQHSLEETFFAFYRVWGLTVPEASFVTTNGERVARVTYGYVSSISRDIASLQAIDLCVFAISSWTREMSILGIKVDPAKYPKMELKIASVTRVGPAKTSHQLGSAEVLLRDGRCVLPEEDNG